MNINSTTPFGDVDYGPTAGIRCVATLEEDETPEDVWAHFIRNYQDDWQDWGLVHAEGATITVDLYTRWGDGHRSKP